MERHQLKIDNNYLKSFNSTNWQMRQVYYAKRSNVFPYLTFFILVRGIEIWCEEDYGITNLEISNGILMLMRKSELKPQPTRRESILFGRIQRK